MIYLDVVPALISYLALLGGITLFSRFTRIGRPLFPILWRSLVASSAGILSANVVLWTMTVTIGSILTAVDPSGQVHLTLPRLLDQLVHPIPMSLVGCAIGVALGMAWACFAGRQPGEPPGNPELAA